MSDGRWLEGRVARVVWASPESGYAVVRIFDGEHEVTAVGTLGPLADDPDGLVDSFVALEGKWEAHAVHGRQFRASGFLQGLPRTLTGLELYLASSGVKGIGKELARRIVEAFGVRALAVLEEEPERLTEIPGIGAKRARSIAARWAEDESGRALAVTLRGLGMSARLVERIRKRYGDQASHVVHREPYRLSEEIRGVGFRTADQLASELGMSPDDPARVRAAAVHVLRQAEQDGHCYLPEAEIAAGVRALDVPVDGLPMALHELVLDRRVIPEGDRFYEPRRFDEERLCAAQVAARVGEGEPATDALVQQAATLEGVELDPLQAQAVARALGGGMVVVTGGPGTGKTTLVRVLVRAARIRDESWLLASPTGRAARRLEEATGTPASTLHRLLEFNPGEGGFQRHAGNPLEGDGLVVDEVSMVDLPLMAALLDALPAPPFPVVLVGDADQLPSVGPGAVLGDLIASGEVDVIRLERIYRQDARSGIVVAASQILAGEVPPSGEKAGWDDFFLVPRDSASAAQQTLTGPIADRLEAKGFDLMEDMQILAPMRRGPLGTQALNELMQQRLNPDGEAIGGRGEGMRVGDRVICVKNRYDVEVFNGDVGRIVGKERTGVIIDFGGRRVGWGWEDMRMLELAYAVTIHKSQGSEYPAVIVVLARGHHVMLRRNLFYTAVTRARRFLCVLGDHAAWQRAVSEARTERRFTALAERVRDACHAPAAEGLFGVE
ncbi:MAG: ATP-dependent RecD-like DNA helicase [Deltaproteobacteria bacterium]|nr:MAG: ATP-dependent RecD-like DNA helicase [Deltaproteobacteria bacterium]